MFLDILCGCAYTVVKITGWNFVAQKGVLCMRDYEKPMMCVAEGSAESIYLSSGAVAETTGEGVCNSIYMQGTFHEKNPHAKTNMEKFGCNTCPQGNSHTCKLPGGPGVYEEDPAGKNKPQWEKNGWDPYGEAKDANDL